MTVQQAGLELQNLRTTEAMGYSISSQQSIVSPQTGTLGSPNDYKVKYLIMKSQNIVPVSLIKCLPCVRDCSKSFTYIIANPHKIPKR